MAVTHPNAQQAQQTTAQPQPEQTFQHPNAGGFQQQQQRPNLGTPIFGMQSALTGMGSGGEHFEKLYAKIQAVIKRLNEEKKTDEKFGAVKLLKYVAGLHYSGIVITETVGDFTAAHVLMVERTGDYPDKITDTYNNVRYEIVRTPGDALDVKYINAAQAAAAQYTKTKLENVIVVDGTLVVNEFDVDNDGSVDVLLDNALKAVHSEIATRVYDYKGQNLQQFIQDYRNGKFIVSLQFNSEDTVFFDPTGMPIRQDVCVSLSFKVGGLTNNRSVNQGDDTVEIVRTYGYIDFEFTGQQTVNGMQLPQKFVPNFVITHIESPRTTPTPDVVMLGVASVTVLNEDMNWSQAFRPTAARKDITDFNDVGALNMEGNIELAATGYGKRYDFKSSKASTAELYRFIQLLVRTNMMISIDVPKAAPETWYTSIFHAIGDRKDIRAYNRLMSAMTASTGGAYQPNNEAVFENLVNKIHGGFYKTKDGYRDLRHVSCYLGVTNHVIDTNQAPALVTQYTNTLYNTQIPVELRAAARREYIDSMTNRSAVYKQTYDRYIFNAGLVSNYVRALRSIGFDPVYSGASGMNDMFVKRNTATFQNAILGQDVRFMATANTMYNGWNANYVRAW